MLLVVHCQPAEDKKCCSSLNVEAGESERGLKASLTSHVCLSYRMKSFSSKTARRDQAERGSAKMITSTSSSHLYLQRIQTLKPLAVGVTGPKRIHERLTLRTQEDAAARHQ